MSAGPTPRGFRWALIAAAVLLVASALRLATTDLATSIDAMAPDRPAIRRQMDLFAHSPFANYVLIEISLPGTPGDPAAPAEAARLNAAAHQTLARMGLPWFDGVTGREANLSPLAIAESIMRSAPALFTQAEADDLAARLDGLDVRARLEAGYRKLFSPAAAGAARLMRVDPLDLIGVFAGKYAAINPTPNARFADGYGLSADGRAALITATTPVAMTDFAGGKALLEHIDAELLAPLTRQGLAVRVFCGHRYTVANAECVQRDVKKVLAVSTLMLAAVFALMLRRLRSLIVFVVPVTAVLAAAAGTSVLDPPLHAITLGFGAVLMGLAVDYALHVFFHVRAGEGVPVRAMVSCAATTMGAFSALLASSLPGQRQLAIFSLIGLAWALAVAVFILGRLLAGREQQAKGPLFPGAGLALGPRGDRLVVAVWLVAIVLAGCFARPRIDGNLRSVGLAPRAILDDELAIRARWGASLSPAMTFAAGSTLDEALAANDRLYAALRAAGATDGAVSLAPICPSRATQLENLRRWRLFWSVDKRGARLRGELADAGEELGFAPDSFDAFYAILDGGGERVTPETLAALGLGELTRLFIVRRESETLVAGFLPDTEATGALFAAGGRCAMPEVTLVSGRRLNAEMSAAILADLKRLGPVAMLAVPVVLLIAVRNLRRCLLSVMPVAAAVVFVFFGAGALGVAINLFNLAGVILLAGLAIDYGIFIGGGHAACGSPASRRAVFASGLTTLGGFAALLTARHPAMYSLGVTVILGLAPALATALLVIPAAERLTRRGS